jgi:UDP-N-acetylglucosamine 2-epimerase (non-hydrolysing)
MFEVLNHYLHKISESQVLNKLELEKYRYFIVSAHREENINSPIRFNNFISILNRLVDEFNIPVIISTHPRTKKRIAEQNIKLNKEIRLLKPFCFSDYVNLQMYAFATLSDSGTISEESSIMNFPALNIREAHERPEAMEEASVMMVGMNEERIIQALSLLSVQQRMEKRTLRLVNDYSMPNVSEKVVRIIVSYTDYINRVVWSVIPE